jgi:rhodanese-related sulfurtransferase
VVDGSRRRNRLAFVSLAALIALGGAGLLFAHAARDAEPVAAAGLLEQIQAGRAPLVLDVRSQGEYAGGHVPGAVHIPFAEAAERAASIEGPRDQPIVVYCELGPRAGVAKLALESAGFTNVHYLDGHMAGWRGAGLPLER